MSAILEYLFGAASFMPHGYCLLWRPDLVALHAISDILIALAYFSIPVGLWYFAKQRPDLEFRGLFMLFACFIMLCGLTHVMGLVTLWAPVYGMQGIVKAVTAAVSLLAAYSLWPVIPKALAIPGLTGLRNANREMRSAITEREALISNLTAANRDLEDFAHSVAHDLRSPLRSINGFSHMLKEECGGEFDPHAQEMVDRIRLASVHMGQIIDDLLFLSRVRQMPLNKSAVNLSEMARSVLDEVAKEMPRTGVDTAVTDGIIAKCDRDLMRIALKHLLGNAWKFMSETSDPKIEFSGEEQNGKTVIHVRDNGAGFDMAQAGKLFLPFQRMHAPDEFNGNGIGLTVVLRVIQRHGGNINVESSPAQGTLFTISL